MAWNLKKLMGCGLWLLGSLLIAATPSGAAGSHVISGKEAERIRERINDTFESWTKAYNAGDIKHACDLYAPDLTANIEGSPQRDYAGLCKAQMDALKTPGQKSRYSVSITEIIASENFAAVRFVWKYSVTQNGSTSDVDGLGMGIFRPQAGGKWKMARLVAYGVNASGLNAVLPRIPAFKIP